MVTPVSLDNFAYQVVVTGGPQPVGLLFRANSAHTCYYQLVKEGTWLKLYLVDGKTERQLYQFRSQYQQWYEYDGRMYKHKPVLLWIVAQGATIDVYENLTYLGRAEDDMLWVCSFTSSWYFSATKQQGMHISGCSYGTLLSVSEHVFSYQRVSSCSTTGDQVAFLSCLMAGFQGV